MTVDLKVEAAEIRRLYFAEHWKRGTIAEQLGVHFDTVARVLGNFGPKAGTPRPDARVLEPYLSFVDETLGRYPRLVATRILDMIVERGYTGSIRTLRRYVHHARPSPKSEVFLRVETLPGEQAQVDWAPLAVGSLVHPGVARDPSGPSSSCSPTRGPCGPSSCSTWASSRCAARCCAPAHSSAARPGSGSSTTPRPSSSSAPATPSAFTPRCSISRPACMCSPRSAACASRTRRARSSGPSATSRTASSPRARSTPRRTATRSCSTSSRMSPTSDRIPGGPSAASSMSSRKRNRACSLYLRRCPRPTPSRPSASTSPPS